MTRSHQPAPARLTIRQERRAWRLPAFHHLARRAVSPSPASLVRPPRGIGPGNSRAHPRPNPAKANSCVNQQFSGCVFHAARCCRGAGPAGRRSGRRPQRRAGMRLAGLNPARGRGNTPQPPPAPRAGRCGPAIPAPACATAHTTMASHRRPRRRSGRHDGGSRPPHASHRFCAHWTIAWLPGHHPRVPDVTSTPGAAGPQGRPFRRGGGSRQRPGHCAMTQHGPPAQR